MAVVQKVLRHADPRITVHQAVGSELLQASADDVGNPGLVRAEDGSSLNLGQPASLNKVNDARGQLSLHEGNFWVWNTDVGKDVAGASCRLLHFSLSIAACASCAILSRDFTKSISALGVALPLFDFFWKACRA